MLDVKSFKRKYPDLSRRTVDVAEKDYLVRVFNLNTLMTDYRNPVSVRGEWKGLQNCMD